jgi:hypothetical protein
METSRDFAQTNLHSTCSVLRSIYTELTALFVRVCSLLNFVMATENFREFSHSLLPRRKRSYSMCVYYGSEFLLTKHVLRKKLTSARVRNLVRKSNLFLRQSYFTTSVPSTGVFLWRNAPERRSGSSFSEGRKPERRSGTFFFLPSI